MPLRSSAHEGLADACFSKIVAETLLPSVRPAIEALIAGQMRDPARQEIWIQFSALSQGRQGAAFVDPVDPSSGSGDPIAGSAWPTALNVKQVEQLPQPR